MRLSLLALLALLGCPSADKDSATDLTDADTDTDTDTDADGDSDTDADSDTTPVDTALAYLVYEGHADLSGTDWVGSESWVAYSVDEVEWCRTNNTYTAPAVTDLCEGCAFGYDATFDPGTLNGDGCDNIGMTADLFDGEEWVYAWAPTYTYTYGGNEYTYENAFLFEYADAWYFWAYGYSDERQTTVDYRGLGYSIYYYYY